MSSGTTQPPLLTLTAEIGEGDPWVMVPTSAGVRLAPIDSPELDHLVKETTDCALVDLTDLGYLDTTDRRASNATTKPSGHPNDTVFLLMAMTLRASLSNLRTQARALSVSSASPIVSDDWILTAPHFVYSSDQINHAPTETGSCSTWGTCGCLAFDGTCRYLFGTPSAVNTTGWWSPRHHATLPNADGHDDPSRRDDVTTYVPSTPAQTNGRRFVASSLRKTSRRSSAEMMVLRGDQPLVTDPSNEAHRGVHDEESERAEQRKVPDNPAGILQPNPTSDRVGDRDI